MSVVDRTYARALYDAASERGRVKEVQAELADLAAVMDQVPELRTALSNPQLDAAARGAILETAVGDGADPLVRNFVRLLAEKGRASNVEGISAEFERLVARAEGQVTVKLTTAHELSERDAAEILARIEKASGRKVEAVREVDPGLIGGIVLEAGSLRADASVRGRLERMRQELRTR